ncbi:MAG: hypothetical protein LBJ61_03345 [Deltaproteobacteria bacterium]|jgi:hypothetical protein|nr:hypothetical protein [Deltaproteobacteria bacterium]
MTDKDPYNGLTAEDVNTSYDYDLLVRLKEDEPNSERGKMAKYRSVTLKVAKQFTHRVTGSRFVITFTPAELDRLRRLALNLFNGSYYRMHEIEPGEDIKAVINGEAPEFTLTRLTEIAKFYELQSHMFLEDILNEDYCQEEIRCRSFPYDDPW